MPVYDYKCQEHGTFEKMQKIADRETAPCPVCEAICTQQITAPKMVNGGFCDKSMKLSKTF